MKKRVKWTACLIMLLCVMCMGAAAETAYESLCLQHGIAGNEVIAWLEIPGASICTPVMRHPKEDAYYAKHDPHGGDCDTGSIYVQAGYNAADFSDPVTLIYGSCATEDLPFGRLQELFSGSFEQLRSLYVHLPQETQEYTVFAAMPYSSIHILHYYDFSVKRRYDSFFDSVYSARLLGMHADQSNRPEAGEDRVVILSTALRGDPMQRYLVMARKRTL